MKRILLFLAIVATLSLAGCKKDGGTTPATTKTDTEKANEWIYSTMSTNYLWSNQLVAKDKSGITTPTQTYFDVNLRYRKDKSVAYRDDTYGDRFSRLAKIEEFRSGIHEMAATEMDYGFGFEPITLTSGGVPFYMQILYVIPGSPADKAGLKRGDAFDQISGQNLVSLSNIGTLLNQSTINLKILNRADAPTINITKGAYYNNPVHHHDIFTIDGVKIGYLFYTHFTSGDDAGEGSYLTTLKNVFKEFKNEGVTKLILDLRYNGGGEVANAQWLASLIIPNSNMGNAWMYMERNYHNGNKSNFEEAKFLPSSEVGATKPENIDELFFITSQYTASASELMIHSLRPFYPGKLHVVGLTTTGKNVGSREFKNTTLGWVMNPITIRIYDKNKESGYETGIAPDAGMQMLEYQRLSGDSRYYDMFPLGDFEHEWLLNKVMSKYFGVQEAVYYVPPVRSAAVQDFKTTAYIRERGLTEPPQRVP